MISVLIQEELNKYNREIRYAFDYIFDTLGYSYRFISDLSYLRQNDILMLYGSKEPEPEDVKGLANHLITIFIKCDTKLYQLNANASGVMSRMLRDVKLFSQTPVLVEHKFTYPAENYTDLDIHACKVNFDLPGNVYYHLANLDDQGETSSFSGNRLPESNSTFYAWKDFPYVDNFLWLLDNLIKEQVKAKNHYIVQKHYWPQAQDMAIGLTHTVDDLQKWDMNSIFLSVIEDIVHFATFHWQHLYRNIWSKLKYMLTNFELYWNFQEFISCERESKLKSTWFIATEPTSEIDYSLDDTDLQDEMRMIQKQGNEIGLLTTDEKLSRESFISSKQIMLRQLQTEQLGIRQHKYILDEKIRDFHQKLMPLYDSSLSYSETSGFKNGMAFPFHPIYGSLQSSYLQIPVCFKDNVLKLSKYHNVSFDDAKQMLKKLFQTTRRSKGLFCVDFNVANYTDIPYCSKLYAYLIALIKGEKAWSATLSDISHWWLLRRCVTIDESEFDFSINFPEDTESFAIQYYGELSILGIEGVESRIEGKTIHFSNVKADACALVRLGKAPVPCGADNEY
jgi:hypothetical protein